jgi:PEP-CTERM motif
MRNQMKKFALCALLSLPMFASAQNLLSNGSFESPLVGAVNAKWETGASPYGDSIAASNGSQYVFFDVDGRAGSVTDTFTAAGNVNVTFDLLRTASGARNRADATWSLSLDGNALTSGLVSALASSNSWISFSQSVTGLSAGVHTLLFSFQAAPGTGKDLAVDNFSVIAANPVPEPESYALMLAGLAAMGLVARRRKQV